MKNPFKSIGGIATSEGSDAPDPADEFSSQLEPIVRRREELNARLAEVDAEISRLRDARSQQLLAGELVTGSTGIAALSEEREVLAGAVATLESRISAVQAQQVAVAESAKRTELVREASAAREAAIAAREAMLTALRNAVSSIPPLIDEARTTATYARIASATVGESWSIDLFPFPVVGNLAATIEAVREAEFFRQQA